MPIHDAHTRGAGRALHLGGARSLGGGQAHLRALDPGHGRGRGARARCPADAQEEQQRNRGREGESVGARGVAAVLCNGLSAVSSPATVANGPPSPFHSRPTCLSPWSLK